MEVNTTNEISIICLNSLDDAMTHTQDSGYTLCMPDGILRTEYSIRRSI